MEAGREPAAGQDLRWRPHRLNALADGVFAIAMTLLALEVRFPAGIGSRSAFRAALPGFFLQLGVFALGFFVIGQYWQRHHRVMHLVEWVDRRDVRRTILALAGVAATPVAVDLITHDAQFPEAVAIAAGMLALTSLLFLFLEAALLRPGLAVIEPRPRRVTLIRGIYSVVVFGSAVPLAYLLPDSSKVPLVWWAMVLVGPVSTGVDRAWQRLRESRRGRRRARPAGPALRRGP